MRLTAFMPGLPIDAAMTMRALLLAGLLLAGGLAAAGAASATDDCRSTQFVAVCLLDDHRDPYGSWSYRNTPVSVGANYILGQGTLTVEQKFSGETGYAVEETSVRFRDTTYSHGDVRVGQWRNWSNQQAEFHGVAVERHAFGVPIVVAAGQWRSDYYYGSYCFNGFHANAAGAWLAAFPPCDYGLANPGPRVPFLARTCVPTPVWLVPSVCGRLPDWPEPPQPV